MKKAITSVAIILLLVMSGSLIASAYISFFNVRSEGQNVFLEWKTQSEDNVTRFAVERKSSTSDNENYTVIAYIKPTGDNSYYSYIDENIYKTSDNLYVYRIAIQNEDGTTNHSNDMRVSVSLSSVKRTWGSIKAMFR